MTNPMDLGPFIVWASGLSTLLALGTTIYNMLTSGARKNDTRLADLSCKLDDVERALGQRMAEADRRIQRAEDRLSTVPTVEMMHRIELTLSSMSGELGKLDERLKPVAGIAERLQEMMLNAARDAK